METQLSGGRSLLQAASPGPRLHSNQKGDSGRQTPGLTHGDLPTPKVPCGDICSVPEQHWQGEPRAVYRLVMFCLGGCLRPSALSQLTAQAFLCLYPWRRVQQGVALIPSAMCMFKECSGPWESLHLGRRPQTGLGWYSLGCGI